MSFISPEQTAYKDGPNLDAFGRLRVSGLHTLFSFQPSPANSTNSLGIHLDNYTSGTGSSTYSAVTGGTTLSTGGSASGARAIRQTKVYWRYVPGKSLFAKFACVLSSAGTPTGKAETRRGYFDDDNGAFFGRDVTGYFVATRTNISGSSVTYKVYQNNWNVDKCDGTGPSGLTADFSQILPFAIDFQSAGGGRIRFAILLGGKVQIVHQVDNGSESATKYLRTLNLPLRAEVINDGGSGSNVSMIDYSMVVEVEDGDDNEGGYWTTAGTKGTVSASLANSATLTPIMSLRLRDTFNGATYRGHTHPYELSMLCKTSDIYWELIWNAMLTGASFANVDATYSGLEIDTAATAQSGGIVVSSGYALSGQGSRAEISNVSATLGYILARTYTNTRDTLTLAARGIGGAATAYAAMNIQEQF